MRQQLPAIHRPGFLFRVAPLAAAAVLAACGGGSGGTDTPTTPVTPAPTTLSGTVAVGAPMTDGRLRVLDANGAVVVADLAIAADGSYPAVTLTGPAPYRIEACGYTGANYGCIYSVAQGAGTANVTPLTNAMMLLASGQAPENLMSGSATGLSANALANAQDTLRTGLAPLLADAGLTGTLDLVSGSLNAGSRTGYDRLLDSVGVSTGTDGQAFVQIVPRLGTGNLYLEQGSGTLGTLTTSSAANALPLAGLETLFNNMTLAVRSATTCAAPGNGMAAQLSSSARMNMGSGGSFNGPAEVALGLCGFLGGGDGEPAYWGSRFLSPMLGRCDFSGSAPVCGVSFVLQDANGNVQPVGMGMAVSYEGGAWKLRGDMHSVSIQASARVQRDRRVDGATPVDTYMRALAFDIPALPGLACATVSQRDSAGTASPLAIFKPHGSNSPERLSAWRVEPASASRSLDPAVGNTRSADDTWLELPQGEAGDRAVRNFYRGGRTVSVALFANSDCTGAFAVDGQSQFEVDVEGVPPVWSALQALPWPELTDTAKAALVSVAANAGSISFNTSWAAPRAGIAVGELTFCSDRARCGDGDTGRIGEGRVAPSARSATMTLQVGAAGLPARSYKMLALNGGTGDGVGVQSNFISCPAVPAGQICEQ